jgi:hypothetical protein
VQGQLKDKAGAAQFKVDGGGCSLSLSLCSPSAARRHAAARAAAARKHHESQNAYISEKI